MQLKYRKSHQIKENITTEEINKKILKLTKHNEIKILNSGNSSILLAMSNIKGNIIIPNQGAWHGFKQAAKLLNKEIITLPTEKGIIKKEHFEDLEYAENSALFLTSFAGYTAEQNMQKISKYCKQENIRLVEDVSGSISDPENKLSNGKYSDIIVCSTGSPKMINAEYGGFITTKIPDFFNESNYLINTLKSNPETILKINTELDYVEDNFIQTVNACNYIKKELEDYVIHSDKRGVNVIFKTKDKNIFKRLKDKLIIDNGKSIITRCPNYNRLKIKGFALEIKNLDIGSLNKSNLDEIINIINENIK